MEEVQKRPTVWCLWSLSVTFATLEDWLEARLFLNNPDLTEFYFQ